VSPSSPSIPLGLNHLDTDVALAFPSLDLTHHPHFNGFTANFASSDAVFLMMFFKALEKMGQLGVDVPLQKATPCIPCSGQIIASISLPLLKLTLILFYLSMLLS
jgi:hypothetical protein